MIFKIIFFRDPETLIADEDIDGLLSFIETTENINKQSEILKMTLLHTATLLKKRNNYFIYFYFYFLKFFRNNFIRFSFNYIFFHLHQKLKF